MAVAAVAFTVVAFGRVKVRLLIVVVPVDAPRERVVAAPNALTVVATVLNTSRDVEADRTEVVKVGEVPKTDTPVPVSSVRVLRRTDDRPE